MFSILRKTVILFVAFIGTISPSYSFASDESSETVLVGVIALRSEDPEIGNKIGTYYGINLDYLTNIAKVLNLELELRSYNTIPELFADIENGTIDGAVGFSKSPDRESRFIFSDAFSLAPSRFGIVKTAITNVIHENSNGFVLSAPFTVNTSKTWGRRKSAQWKVALKPLKKSEAVAQTL